MNDTRVKNAVGELLESLGEDRAKEGLKDTPQRVADMYQELLSGSKQEAEKIISKTYTAKHDEMILLKGISFYSLCEHHLLPFFGECHIAYIPKGNKIAGISSIIRVVEILSKRLQIQEQFTSEIADILTASLQPKGVAVVVKARHLCLEMRGAKKPHTLITTSALRGWFKKDNKTREEFLNLIR